MMIVLILSTLIHNAATLHHCQFTYCADLYRDPRTSIRMGSRRLPQPLNIIRAYYSAATNHNTSHVITYIAV